MRDWMSAGSRGQQRSLEGLRDSSRSEAEERAEKSESKGANRRDAAGDLIPNLEYSKFGMRSPPRAPHDYNPATAVRALTEAAKRRPTDGVSSPWPRGGDSISSRQIASSSLNASSPRAWP